MADGSNPAELESGWRGWEAPTSNHVGVNGDQIHAQGFVKSQNPTAESAVAR